MATTFDDDDIITRSFSNFLGVDFRGGEVPYYHSPDALNMWKDYTDSSCIQTRPGMTLINSLGDEIHGLFFFSTGTTIKVLVHLGTKMYLWNGYPTTTDKTLLMEDLSTNEGHSFVYDGVFYYMDGKEFYKYDGNTMSKVVGTIPTITYFRLPDGTTLTDSDTDAEGDNIYQYANALTPKQRNRFVADGTSTEYHLSNTNLDTAVVQVEVYDVTAGTTTTMTEGTDFTVNRTSGVITFKTVIASENQVFVLFEKTEDGYRDRITKCTKVCEFDNRIFLTGNPDYPNSIFWCSESDPEMYSIDDYLEIGIDLAEIKDITAGNNVLWVFKEYSQSNASVYYLTPTINSTYGKYYTPVGGNIAVGCISRGINFNDDIVFFSNQGMEAVSSSSMYSEQILTHRSTYVDAKMVSDADYENIKLAEYNGYLMCLIGNKVFLADQRQMVSTGKGTEYEWFYWELPNNINYMTTYRGTLYLCNKLGEVYKLDGTQDNGVDISSYWTTRKDDFGYPSYTKTTNKKGGAVTLKQMNNDAITMASIPDGNVKSVVTLSDTKGYAVFKIKNKKFYKIQFKLSSNKPFGIYSVSMQGFIAGYVKR